MRKLRVTERQDLRMPPEWESVGKLRMVMTVHDICELTGWARARVVNFLAYNRVYYEERGKPLLVHAGSFFVALYRAFDANDVVTLEKEWYARTEASKKPDEHPTEYEREIG